MTPAAGSAPGRAPLREFSRRIGSATVTVEAREQLGTQADALLDIVAAYADELRDGAVVSPTRIDAIISPPPAWRSSGRSEPRAVPSGAEVSPAQPPRVASAGPDGRLLGSRG
ncbi:hypothetical protein [Micromonospora sp. NPDC001898]|uniref:hypothetical protein n=1 Tax=Micromonospora sp. NPDC001898 TaxID=3364221 RepID=UPI00368821A1